MNRSRTGVFACCTPVTVVLLVARGALAQEASTGASGQVAVQAQTQTSTQAPPPPVVITTIGNSAHDAFVGRLGFGWYGTKPIPVGVPTTMGNGQQATPVVGVRYWATPTIGIDGALGFFTRSGSTTTPPGTVVDSPSATTFVLHGGVPIALANTGNFSFQVTPELDIGFGTGSIPATAPAMSADLSGFLLQVGARVGGEVHFGFIGIPQLALDASVGAYLASTSAKTTTGPNAVKVSTLTITTTDVYQPWNIFLTNVAVRYYL